MTFNNGGIKLLGDRFRKETIVSADLKPCTSKTGCAPFHINDAIDATNEPWVAWAYRSVAVVDGIKPEAPTMNTLFLIIFCATCQRLKFCAVSSQLNPMK